MWSDFLATQRKCKGTFHWLWDTFIWVNKCTRKHYRFAVASHYRLEGHPKQTPLSGLCLCVGKHFNTISLQLTKDMLDSHQRFPYPPMIKLEIQPTTLNLRSTEVPVEIVGIREAGKTFILNPKLRPSQSTTTRIHIKYHVVISVVYCGASLLHIVRPKPPIISTWTAIYQCLLTLRSQLLLVHSVHHSSPHRLP